MSIQHLCEAWLDAKATETRAIEARRVAEDALTKALDIRDGDEGSKTFHADGFAVKTTCRLNHKIDSDKLQELATDAGIGNDVLSGLFRWKPELSVKEWRAAAPAITGALAGAITTTAGRTSYTITKEDI